VTDTMEILAHDHRAIQRMSSALSDATAASARERELANLKLALTLHIATEEQLVYPTLKTIAGTKSMYRQLYRYTAKVEALVNELKRMLEVGDLEYFAAKSQELQVIIAAHIADQERSALTELNEHARTQQLQFLNAAVLVFRVSSHFTLPSRT
jgi:hypothetical protein